MTIIAKRVGVCAALAAVAFIGAACDDSETGLALAMEPEGEEVAGLQIVGATLVAVTPTEQDGTVGELVEIAPRVRVISAGGEAMGGVGVRFYVVEGGGRVSAQRVNTNPNGYASVDWRLGPAAGRNRLRVALPQDDAIFIAHASPPPATVVDVEVAPGTLTLESLGQMEQLVALAYDGSGTTVPTQITWRSLNATVVAVDSTGMVRSTGNGTAGIVATAANGIADTAEVAVAQRVAAVTVAPAIDSVAVAGSVQLAATASDANGYPVQNAAMQWASDHPVIASVSALGLVTGLASGVAIITATSDGASDSARIVVEAPVPPPPPPPGDGTFLFHSDWSTARGSSTDALLDRSKTHPWVTIIGNGSADVVIGSSGLDFPTANVYQSIAEWRSGGVQAQNPRYEGAALDIPLAGETRAYRWYFRVAVPDAIDPSGGSPHPIQDGPSASAANWVFRFYVERDGTFRPGFGFNQTAYPNNRFTLNGALPKNQTFRFELLVRRTGAATFTAQARIYDSRGALVYDEHDFRNQNGSGSVSLADAPQLTLDASVLGGFQVGSNGPSWSNVPQSAFPFTLWYTGGVAVCTTWCGPYSSAESN